MLPNSRGITVRVCPKGVQHAASVSAHLLLHHRPGSGSTGLSPRTQSCNVAEPGFEPGFLNSGQVLLGQFLTFDGKQNRERERTASVYILCPGPVAGEQSGRMVFQAQLRGPCEQEEGRRGHGTWNRGSHLTCAWSAPRVTGA